MAVALIATVVLLAQHHVGTANWTVMAVGGVVGGGAACGRPAGLDNELYADPKTEMFFSDAQEDSPPCWRR